MKLKKNMFIGFLAFCLFLAFMPTTHAVQLNTPQYRTIPAGSSTGFVVPISDMTVVLATIEVETSASNVKGEYSIVKNNVQHKLGNYSASTNSPATVGLSYYSPPYVGVLTVENPGTQPVTIKVTFTSP